MQHKADICIIGGGAIGQSCAWYLRQAGLDVTILEAKSPGSGSSGGNAGMIVPSHFIPMASPGVISQGLRWLMKRDSPFYIRPTLSFKLFRWLLLFMQAAKHKRVEEAMPVLRDLSLASLEEYQKLAKQLDIPVNHQGILLLYNTSEGEAECQTLAKEGNEVGIDVQLHTRDAVNKLDPNLHTVARGAAYFPQDSHLNPTELMTSLEKSLRAQGVSIQSGVRVTRLSKTSGGINLETNRGSIACQQVVITAGAWSSTLTDSLGLNMPLQGGKGYSMDILPGDRQLKIPLLLAEAKVAITPMAEKLRFAGTLELCGTDTKVRPNRVKGIANSVQEYLPQFNPAEIMDSQIWQGLRPCSPDGLPYIGRFKKYPSVLTATGHGMLGISLAPITGKLIAETILEKPLTISSPLFSADRFY